MSSGTAARGDTSDHQTLVDLNENYIRSVQESDVRWFEAHLSADFLNTNPDGSMVDRAGFLAQIAKPVTIRGLRCEDVRVRLEGDVAIVHARTTYARPDGQPGAGRYTDIWARRQGRWICIAAHVTRG
jgi:ketosteroid isomerase-like protein